MRVIFIITIVGFFAGIFVGFGSYLFGNVASLDTVISINKSKVPLALYNTLYTNTLSQIQNASTGTITQEQISQIKARTVESLVQDEIFYQQSKDYKIIVSDIELRSNIENSPMFSENGVFSGRIYFNFLRNINMTPKDYEGLIRKQIAIQKMKNILIASVKITNSEFGLMRQLNPNLDANDYAQYKVNRVLNEWYVNILRNSKVNVNEELIR
jgi:peptidyl-prolyl cis-trans isomerase D